MQGIFYQLRTGKLFCQRCNWMLQSSWWKCRIPCPAMFWGYHNHCWIGDRLGQYIFSMHLNFVEWILVCKGVDQPLMHNPVSCNWGKVASWKPHGWFYSLRSLP